jgi:hypothetical protein
VVLVENQARSRPKDRRLKAIGGFLHQFDDEGKDTSVVHAPDAVIVARAACGCGQAEASASRESAISSAHASMASQSRKSPAGMASCAGRWLVSRSTTPTGGASGS